MNCTNCGSSISIGGPRCCDGGAAKREAEAALAARVGRIEAALKTLYQHHWCKGSNGDECAICNMDSEMRHG